MTATGTVRISAAYGITKPGEVPYSSENIRIAIDIEDDMSQEAAETLLASLTQQVKIAVIAEAGLSASTDENGVISPVFTARSQGAATPAASTVEAQATVTPITEAPSAQAPAPQAQGGGAKDMTWDGRPVVVYDNRGKKASGEYKPNAADFRLKFKDVGEEAPDDVKFKPVWINNTNGSVNQAGLALQQAFDA
jgi:hypothetical protein